MNATSFRATFNVRNAFNQSSRLALVLVSCLHGGSNFDLQAGVVDFTGINLAQVSSASGQNFGYVEGVSGPSGTVNVMLVSGVVDTLTIGSSPDPTGFYALQATPQTIGIPFLFNFTFSSSVDFTISENETLTSYEVNTLSVPASGTLSLLSSADALVTSGLNQITFQGATAGGGAPYGTYTALGSGSSLDFFVRNQPGAFTLYGSSISINVVPEPSSVIGLMLGGLLTVLWRCRFGRFARPLKQ
jgi:PEP-CTERM motif